MYRENHRHEGAGPSRAGGSAEEREKEHRGQRVEGGTGEMMPARPETENLHIEHVRKARHGKPVRGLGAGKRPDDAVHSTAAADVRVVGNVIRIVEVDEAMPVKRQI